MDIHTTLVGITLSQRNIVNSRQIHHTEKMIKLAWTHPTKGEIEEILCENHEVELIKALRVLGIGYSGTFATGVCMRCIYDGYDFREWMNLYG
jgi:hypothetical protein